MHYRIYDDENELIEEGKAETMREIEQGPIANPGWWLGDDSPDQHSDGDMGLPVWGERDEEREDGQWTTVHTQRGVLLYG